MCLCSVLSKEQGITVIAVCLAYEFLVLQKVILYALHQLVQSHSNRLIVVHTYIAKLHPRLSKIVH